MISCSDLKVLYLQSFEDFQKVLQRRVLVTYEPLPHRLVFLLQSTVGLVGLFEELMENTGTFMETFNLQL